MKKFDRSIRSRAAAGIFAAACTAALMTGGCSSTAASAEKGAVLTTSAAAQELSPAPSAVLSQDTVTVSSRASVYAVPDRAELHFGVRTQAGTAVEAQQENSKNVDSVIGVLKKNGIREEDIQTTMYDVSPQYDWNTGDGSEIIGYSVYSNLSVKSVSIDDAGKLISACTGAGANEFNGISYSCTNYDAMYAEALQNAIASSKEKAAAMAGATGRTLGDVKMMTEGYQDMTYASRNEKSFSMNDAGAMGAAEEAASLMPGEAEITATVTVTYVLR